MVVGVTLSTVALILGLYATAISTVVALVTLYGEVFARVNVLAREGYLVPFTGGQRPLLVFGGDMLETMGAADAPRYDIVQISIRNRGRRPIQIKLVSKAGGPKGFYVLDELLPSMPFLIQAGHTAELTLGAPPTQPYTPGDIGPMKRFFVLDGAGRIHPLRERWRQAPMRQWRRLRRWFNARRQRRRTMVT